MIGQIVQIIREISEKADSMSVHDLADVISRDPSTMTRILGIAGTLGYNPGGAEITSIPQAIAVVGFERIRNLAISVMLLENVEQSCGVEINRELAGLSLTGGLIAAGICKLNGKVEPDLGFLCGALRSYGRMLMATFLSEEYSKILACGAGGTVPDHVFRKNFGLTPLELGRELFHNMQLPQMILRTFQDIPEATRDRLGESPSGALLLAADLGLRIADALATRDLTEEDFARRMADITQGYPEGFELTNQQTGDLVKEISSQISSFSQAGRFSKGNVVLFQRMDCLAEGRKPPPPFAPKVKRQVPPPELPPAKRASGILGTAQVEIDRMLDAPQTEIHALLSLVIQALLDALSLESCLVFVRQSQGAFHLEHGAGPLLESIDRAIMLRADQRDVFGVPVSRGEDVLIQNPDDPRMRAFVPEWLRRPGHALPFLLLPLKDSTGTYGLLCGICRNAAAFALVGQVNSELRLFRAKLVRLGSRIRARQP